MPLSYLSPMLTFVTAGANCSQDLRCKSSIEGAVAAHQPRLGPHPIDEFLVRAEVQSLGSPSKAGREGAATLETDAETGVLPRSPTTSMWRIF